jgi:hypothetical protein
LDTALFLIQIVSRPDCSGNRIAVHRRRYYAMKLDKEVKIFAVLMVVAFAISGGAIYLRFFAKPAVIHSPMALMLPKEMLIPSWSAFQGDPKASFTLVEFGDYECPACRNLEPTIAKIMRDRAGKMNRVFHHCTVVDDHPHARQLALAVQAAGEQGKRWQMHEAILQNQEAFDGASPERVKDELTKLARGIGLDIERFHKDRESQSAREAVDRMEAVAESMKVSVTPTFCIARPNGLMLFRSITDMKYWLNQRDFWK